LFFPLPPRVSARAAPRFALVLSAVLGAGLGVIAIADPSLAASDTISPSAAKLIAAAKAGYTSAALVAPAPIRLAAPFIVDAHPAPAPAPRLADPPAARSGDVDCLASAVYYEARGESAAGQAAVAQVVLNRTHYPAYPRSVCGVVYQRVSARSCQFSFVCNGAMRRPREAAAWTRARGVAGRALGGYVMTAVSQAISFHVAPPGAERAGQVARLGSHVFFGAQSRTASASRPRRTVTVLARAGLIKVSAPSSAGVSGGFTADSQSGRLVTRASLNTSEVAASGASD
jgi:spore germination cell wall hydrolase CwlJ-like protein